MVSESILGPPLRTLNLTTPPTTLPASPLRLLKGQRQLIHGALWLVSGLWQRLLRNRLRDIYVHGECRIQRLRLFFSHRHCCCSRSFLYRLHLI